MIEKDMVSEDIPNIDGLTERVLGGVLIGNGFGDELQDVRSSYGDDIANKVEQRIEENN